MMKNYNEKVTVSVELSVMQLVEALEKILPAGEMVIVGSGNCMTDAHKAWLRSLIGDAPCKCECECEDRDAIEQAAYDEGYNDGYADAEMECNEEEEAIYDRGYDHGEENGYERGYREGHDEGYTEGFENAKAELREWLD